MNINDLYSSYYLFHIPFVIVVTVAYSLNNKPKKRENDLLYYFSKFTALIYLK